jgi:EAL domain-containing protein (putative c-di-GMP-specific phosphodiesterase class I)
MSRSAGLAHILRHDDGVATGVWGVYTLKSAFQPIFAFKGGKLAVVAFEGLLRPFRSHEPVSPGYFFGAIPSIDRFHVETLSRTLHLLNAGAFLDPAASVFVNFDPSLFGDREVADVAIRDMRLVLHEADIPPSRIVCEMTEQRSASETTLLQLVDMLRSNGFRIAVDDYGAEDSDFNRIERLRPDIVKFDAQWVSRLMESGSGIGLLDAIVASFKERDIPTVFEGIEEPWQLDLAERLGATMVQGFALARPEIAPTSFSSFRRKASAGVEVKPARAEPAGAAGSAEQAKPAVPLRRVFGRRVGAG